MNRLALSFLLVGLRILTLPSWAFTTLSSLSPLSRSIVSSSPPQRQMTPLLSLWAKQKKNNDHEEEKDEEDDLPLGMEEAFAKLDSLESLNQPSSSSSSSRPGANDTSSSSLPSSSSSSSSLPLEKEIEVYKNLMNESESKDAVYSDVLSDMKDPPSSSSGSKSKKDGSLLDDPAMQQALADALQQASNKNPSVSADALDDKEIMKEIEAIMERGNAELLASLEEIRQEQRAYAASKAADSAQKAVDDYEASQEARLAAAEKAVKLWLQRVKTEQAAVQQAVDDLAAAQKEMDGGAMSKLREGGLPKQMALVGLVLFSVRSIVDTVASLTDPSLFTGALVQGGIALACAVYLFLL